MAVAGHDGEVLPEELSERRGLRGGLDDDEGLGHTGPVTMPRLSTPGTRPDEQSPRQAPSRDPRFRGAGAPPRSARRPVRRAAMSASASRGSSGSRTARRAAASGGRSGSAAAVRAATATFSRRRSSSGSSARRSSASRTRIAPSFRSAFDPRASGARTEPGTAATSRPYPAAQRAVMREPLFSAASTTHTMRERPAMSRLRTGKCHGSGSSPIGNSESAVPLPRSSSRRPRCSGG